MSVPISITKRDRIYINPFNGKVLPRLTKGITEDTSEDNPDLGDGGEPQEESASTGEAGEDKTE
jgi:hypothetical protein